jgi:DNA-binding response OmpR family regulator
VDKRLLVVEDHGPSRDGLQSWFRSRGWRVAVAADGWEALRRIKETWLDAAVVDLDLPPVRGVALSGWDVVRLLHAFRSETVIVVMSAEGGYDVRAHAGRLGVLDVVEKPIGPEHLKTLAGALEARIAERSAAHPEMTEPRAGGRQ